MTRNMWISLPSFVLLASLGIARPSSGGVITFSGDSALVSALGGTKSTGVNQVALGQTVTVPFSATVTGIESVSGTVVLTETAGGGSVQLQDVVFTSLSATSSVLGFGLSVNQAFAATGPTTLGADETGTSSAHFTGVGAAIQPGSSVVTAGVTFQESIHPDNSGTSFGSIPRSFSAFSFPSDTFPNDQGLSSLSMLSTGIPKTTGNPVVLTFGYSTTLSPFNTVMAADTSTTLSSGSLSFTNAAVPEPSSLGLLGAAVSALAVARWRRRRD